MDVVTIDHHREEVGLRGQERTHMTVESILVRDVNLLNQCLHRFKLAIADIIIYHHSIS